MSDTLFPCPPWAFALVPLSFGSFPGNDNHPMTDTDHTLLGTLVDVSGAQFIARLGPRGDAPDAHRRIGAERVAPGQVGAYVIARAARAIT